MREPLALTRYRSQSVRYFGYTAWDWLKFYGLIAGLCFFIAINYVRYFELFDDIEAKSKAYQTFVIWFSGLPLLLAALAVIGFIWWASGALVRYSRWQESYPLFWRIFWLCVLLFYTFVEFDPFDRIHPQMSRQGLAPALNVLELFEGKVETFSFQWGYFLLWLLLWFLIGVLHWYYFLAGIRIVWFYIRRFYRYALSVLTGFRETMKTAYQPAAGLSDPLLPQPSPVFMEVPRLAVESITLEQAQAIIAADTSKAITASPNQPLALFVDLGRFECSTALKALRSADGLPLLSFDRSQALPAATREELIVPLKSSSATLLKIRFGAERSTDAEAEA